MKTKTLAYLVSTLVVLATVAIIYWQISRLKVPEKQKDDSKKQGTATTNELVVQYTANDGCDFPLKVGSKNVCVGQLQDILGIIVDNSFGSKTLASLQAQLGMSQVNSWEELEAAVNKLPIQQITDNFSGRSQLILDAYARKTYRNLLITKDTVWNEIIRDVTTIWINAGYKISLKKGVKMSLTSYSPEQIDPATGKLVVLCPTGANAGWWLVNPNDVTLV